jgi:hypothetical protein
MIEIIEIILSFFLLVTYFIRYLFSTGENRKQAKADLKDNFVLVMKDKDYLVLLWDW